MISAIGINAVHLGGAVGAGRAASAPDPAPVSGREKPAEEKTPAQRADPVPVRPANIGGGSAIAAQIEAGRQDAGKAPATSSEQTADKTAEKSPEKSSDKPAGDTDAAGLTDEERAQVKKLAARDREVKAHEAAHQAVGGQYAGPASFTFEQGPDGRRYAVGGEVSIDISAVPGDPDATIRKLRTVRRAALAPAEPSAQDRSVAAAAEAGVRAAQTQRQTQQAEERAENAASPALQQPAAAPPGAEAASDQSSVPDSEAAPDKDPAPGPAANSFAAETSRRDIRV